MATPSQFDRRVLGLQEQKALAEKLRQTGLDMPQGQMVSGFYVAPSLGQYLAKGLQLYSGIKGEQEAKQGIENLYGEREAQRKTFLESMPKERVTPDSKVIQPQYKDYVSWATKGAEDFPTEATLGIKMGEMQQAQALKQAELDAARQERLGQREWQAEMQRQRLEDQRRSQEANTRLAAELRQPRQAPRPMAIIDPATGQARYVPPEEAVGKVPALAEKPLSEFQGKSVGFGMRTGKAHNLLSVLDEKIDPSKLAAFEATGAVGNMIAPDEYQKYMQAKRDFIYATLRQESGAAIGKDEFQNAEKQYFPQPGDKPEVIAQKQANRMQVVKGFMKQAGPGAVDIQNEITATPGANIIPSLDDINAEWNRRQGVAQ